MQTKQLTFLSLLLVSTQQVCESAQLNYGSGHLGSFAPANCGSSGQMLCLEVQDPATTDTTCSADQSICTGHFQFNPLSDSVLSSRFSVPDGYQVKVKDTTRLELVVKARVRDSTCTSRQQTFEASNITASIQGDATTSVETVAAFSQVDRCQISTVLTLELKGNTTQDELTFTSITWNIHRNDNSGPATADTSEQQFRYFSDKNWIKAKGGTLSVEPIETATDDDNDDDTVVSFKNPSGISIIFFTLAAVLLIATISVGCFLLVTTRKEEATTKKNVIPHYMSSGDTVASRIRSSSTILTPASTHDLHSTCNLHVGGDGDEEEPSSLTGSIRRLSNSMRMGFRSSSNSARLMIGVQQGEWYD